MIIILPILGKFLFFFFHLFLLLLFFNFYRYYTSENGYITDLIMKKHFMDVLLPHINKRQEDFLLPGGMIPRALLFLDGHATRRIPEIWRKAYEYKIDTIILPSHTSHLLQPLDRNPFAALKKFCFNIFIYLFILFILFIFYLF
jgi:hypothetical protein